MRKVPKLRFKEFSDEWEEKKLGDFITINGRIGFRGYTVNDIVDSKEKGAIALSPTNLLENKIDFSKLTYISNFKYEESPEIKLQVNDILLVKTGSSYGKVGFLTNLPWKATINPQLVIIKTKLNKSFIYYFMNTFIFQNQIEKNIVGGAIPTLSQESIKKFKFFYTTIQEQEKIANFLSSIDKKISLIEEKLELFREYKKGVMQKIFSQKLRFKDSEGNDYPEWKEKRLGEILIKNKEKNKNNQYTLVQSISNKYGFVNQDEYFEDRKIASNNLNNYYIVKNKNFAYNPSRINVGSLAYKEDFLISVISPLYVSFYADNNYIKDIFLLNWFFSSPFYKQMNSSFEGSVRNNLSYDTLSNFNIQLPVLEEQQKIADFLSSIDSKIESIEKELEGLKEFKKGLLQQMFV